MKKLLLAFLTLHLLFSCEQKRVETEASIPPVIAVVFDGGLGSGDGTIVKVWQDGRILWSSDRKWGGPPFFEGQIAPARIMALLEQCEASGDFSEKEENLYHLGPDGPTHSIALEMGEKHMHAQTWHESFEENPNWVADSHGAGPIEKGKTREEVLAADTMEYQEFRKRWTRLRTSIDELIPEKGTPVEVSAEAVR